MAVGRPYSDPRVRLIANNHLLSQKSYFDRLRNLAGTARVMTDISTSKRGVIMANPQQHGLSRPLPGSVAEGESEAWTIVLAIVVCSVAGSLYLLA